MNRRLLLLCGLLFFSLVAASIGLKTAAQSRPVVVGAAVASPAALAASLPGEFILQGSLRAAQQSTAGTKAGASGKPADPLAGLISVAGVKDIDPTKAFGSKSAPVVIEIFSDFQCPACKQLFTTTTQRVMDHYVNSNKVFMIHRDFPLPMHAYSRLAASYSRAAAHIGHCEPVEQALFQNQERWEATGDVKGAVAAVLSPGEMKRVQALVESQTLEPLIDKDKQIGQSVPINQTPTLLIHTRNGQSYPVIGYVSFDVLKTLLDQLVQQ